MINWYICPFFWCLSLTLFFSTALSDTPFKKMQLYGRSSECFIIIEITADEICLVQDRNFSGMGKCVVGVKTSLCYPSSTVKFVPSHLSGNDTHTLCACWQSRLFYTNLLFKIERNLLLSRKAMERSRICWMHSFFLSLWNKK